MLVFYVLGSIALVSLISLVGAFALVLKKELLQRGVFILAGLAAGALLGDAFIHIIPEAYEGIGDPTRVSFLIIAGVLAFFALEKVFHWHHEHTSEHAEEFPHPVGKMVLVSDGVHNFIDGLIITASYLVSVEVGVATTIAVILHEIPQEIGNFGVLVHAGYSTNRALWFNFLSALTAFAGALVALALGGVTAEFALWLLPLTAGSFIYIALSDLVPELHKSRHVGQGALQVLAIIAGVAAMATLLALE